MQESLLPVPERSVRGALGSFMKLGEDKLRFIRIIKLHLLRQTDRISIIIASNTARLIVLGLLPCTNCLEVDPIEYRLLVARPEGIMPAVRPQDEHIPGLQSPFMILLGYIKRSLVHKQQIEYAKIRPVGMLLAGFICNSVRLYEKRQRRRTKCE